MFVIFEIRIDPRDDCMVKERQNELHQNEIRKLFLIRIQYKNIKYQHEQ